MIKRIFTTMVAVAALAAVTVLATPATAALASACQGNGTGCTKAGTYTENAVINSNYGGVFNVVWVKSVVASYPSGSIPVKWTAYVNYTNETSSTQPLTCNGPDNTIIDENLSGGSGDTNGSVSASYSLCSQNPNYSVNVPPGGTATDWVVFGNVPWPGTSVSLTWDAGSVGTSSYIYPFGPGDTDWAGSSFCSTHYSQPALSYSNWGVTPCGQPFSVGNTQGPIVYKGVTLDSVGFQCVELAARYFWFETTLKPPHTLHAKDFVAALHSMYRQYTVTGNTDTFSSSLKPGQIISMGDGTNDSADGHVGVVTAVSVTNGNGTITIMNENASATGEDTITVSGGKFTNTSVGSFPDFAWTKNLPY